MMCDYGSCSQCDGSGGGPCGWYWDDGLLREEMPPPEHQPPKETRVAWWKRDHSRVVGHAL